MSHLRITSVNYFLKRIPFEASLFHLPWNGERWMIAKNLTTSSLVRKSYFNCLFSSPFIATFCRNAFPFWDGRILRLNSSMTRLRKGQSLKSVDSKDGSNVKVHQDELDEPSITLHSAEVEDIARGVAAGDDPKRKLVAYVDGAYTSMKAVDLYALIRKMDVEQILLLVEHSCHILDETHLALSLKRLHKLVKHTRHSEYTQPAALQADHRFQILCAWLARKARLLDPSVLADVVTFLNHFRLPSTHPAMQVCLQLTMKQINGLQLDQLAVIVQIIGDMTPTKQINVLTEAIKVLCQTRRHQLATLSVEHMICLLGAFGYYLSYSDELLKRLWKDRIDIYQWQQALAFFVSLGQMSTKSAAGDKFRMPRRHRGLERWCLEVVSQQLKWMKVRELKDFLAACCQLGRYDGEVLQRIGQRAVDESFTVDDQLAIWSFLANSGHFHRELSMAVLNSVTEADFGLLSLESSLDLLMLATEVAFVDADCVVQHCSNISPDSISNTSMKNDDFVDKHITVLNVLKDKILGQLSVESSAATVATSRLVDACLHFTLLNVAPPSCMIKIISDSIDTLLQQSLGAKGLTLGEKISLMINLLNPATFSDNRIPEMLALVRKYQISRPHSVLTPVFKMNKLDVVHGHITPSGLYTDHLVHGVSENFPGTSTGVFCWYYGSHFWRNTSCLRCLPKLYAMTIQQTCNYNVVIVTANSWLKLTDRERVDYLTNRITKTVEPFTVI